MQIESSLKPADPEHERIDADAPSRKDKPPQDVYFYFFNPMWKIRKYQVQGTQKFW